MNKLKYVIAFLFVGTVLVTAQEAKIVSVETGKVSGVLVDEESNLMAYKGIPYAAPPVGDLRWKAPKPAKKWGGVRDGSNFGKYSLQGANPNRGRTLDQMSEDCLFLNVWSTNVGQKKKLPVMVWIHGGGLFSGASNWGFYDGSEFAKDGVILVSINYRLGVLGFLSHPELSAENKEGVSGNYGFMDQIAALEWVQRNIEAFGGDKDNVTIFGESAGGTSVNFLCASPKTKGLFHKAIMQSPWLHWANGPNNTYLKKPFANNKSGEDAGADWGKLATKEDGNHLAKLRNMDAFDILKVGAFAPQVVVDGVYMNDMIDHVFFKGEQHDIPVLVGTNRNEGNFFTNFIKPLPYERFKKNLKSFYGTETEKVAAIYVPKNKERANRVRSQFVTDVWFLEPTVTILRGMEKVKSQAYQYEFSVPNRKNPRAGTPHAMDLTYVFNTLSKDATEMDHKVSRAMLSYWSQFAKTGNPNKNGLPTWPEYDIKNQKYLEIGDEIKVGDHYRADIYDVLHAARQQHYKD